MFKNTLLATLSIFIVTFYNGHLIDKAQTEIQGELVSSIFKMNETNYKFNYAQRKLIEGKLQAQIDSNNVKHDVRFEDFEVLRSTFKERAVFTNKVISAVADSLLFTNSEITKSHDKLLEVINQDIPKEAAKHVRRFQIMSRDLQTYGTGFNIVHRGKYFLITNRHVCDISKDLGHPNEAVVNGNILKILKIWDKHDLCALASDRESGLELAHQDTEPLDKVTLIGHPRGIDLTIREGRIIKEDERICVRYPEGKACRKSDMTSTTSYGGNSGSPVINQQGRVVGVLYAGDNRFPYEPFIVPFEYLKEFLDSLVDDDPTIPFIL